MERYRKSGKRPRTAQKTFKTSEI